MSLKMVFQKRPCGCNGAAIVELALAVPLMLGMIFFLTIFGRMLSERNRMLAAERTVGWLATRQRDGKGVASGKEEGFPDNQRESFALLLRALHFNERGRAAGIVRIAPQRGWRSGLFAGSAEMSGMQEDVQEQFDQASLKNEEQFEEPNHPRGETSHTDDSPSVTEELATGLGKMMSMFMTFITDEFYTYTATVEYAMPLLFPQAAYEFFLGPMGSGGIEGATELRQARGGVSYAWLRPQDERTGITFPLVDAGGKEVGKEMSGHLLSLLDRAMKRNKDDEEELYRPHILRDGNENIIDGFDLARTRLDLEGLMYYEYFDPDQVAARKPDETQSGFWFWKITSSDLFAEQKHFNPPCD
jgi:hypothetical protein